MKRIGLFLLAVVMVAGLAGCNKDGTADVVGTWVLTYDWYCDSIAVGNVALHLQHNGTLIVSGGGSGTGTFNVDGHDITINFSSGTIYSGKVDGGSMSGSMIAASNGATGCWTANRTSTTP